MDHHNLCYGCFSDKGNQNSCPHCGYVPDNSKEAALYLAPGTTLAGKYLVGKVLGQGGFGITYLGWDTNLDIRIAIKEFFPQGLVSRVPGENTVLSYSGAVKEQFSFGVESFLREAKTLARFEHHPNIVTVRDFFRENNTAYLVMSFIEGVTLLEHLKRSGGKITVEQAVQIILPVTDALKEVHKAGIMHRDISPDNIFIDREGRVLVIDFGAARQELREKSKSLSVILKAGYAPEEQYRSRGKQGPWTDVYSLAATFYRSITGQTPLEAIDRLAEDELIPPSQLGIAIEPDLENALLKALAVKAEKRYQQVEEFQQVLIDALPGRAETVIAEAVSTIKPEAISSAKKIKGGFDLQGKEANANKKPINEVAPGKRDRSPIQKWYRNIKEVVLVRSRVSSFKYAAILIVCGLLLFGSIKLFSDGIDPDKLADLDADYYIDYKNGTIPIGGLPIGARVVDPSWQWEFRTGDNYSGSGEVKPVTWIVVAKDHYDGLEPHVTLLSEELIGKHVFDDSTNRIREYGENNWGDSGSANATRGLRPWLNSSGIHSGEGFYRAFSRSFRGAVLTTTLPNKECKNGSAYSTQDRVFLPSTTELGDTKHSDTYRIGAAYPYFRWEGDAKRVARIGGKTRGYWTRSPDSSYGYIVRLVNSAGEFNYYSANDIHRAVRPALNLKSDTLVSEIRN
jgi:serine/threonine protein kinase